MGIEREISQSLDGLGGIGEGLGGLWKRLTTKPPAPSAEEIAARTAVTEAQQQAQAAIATAQRNVAVAQVKATADAVTAQAKATVKAIEKGKSLPGTAKPWTFGRVLTKPSRMSANLALSTIDTAAGAFLKPLKWLSNGVGGAFRARPGVSLAVTAGTAAVAAGSWFANRESKTMQAQSDAIQQMQAMQAMSAQPQYINNPEASQAFVDARIAADREQGVAGNSKADAVMAARSKQPAPEAANAAAL